MIWNIVLCFFKSITITNFIQKSEVLSGCSTWLKHGRSILYVRRSCREVEPAFKDDSLINGRQDPEYHVFHVYVNRS